MQKSTSSPRLTTLSKTRTPITQWLLVACLSSSLVGCTLVKLTPEGETVDIRANSGTAECGRIGVITVSGVDKVGFINRKDSKVGNELLNQARNDAASMGANVLVPIGEPVEGRQKFEAFNCP